MLHLCEQPVAEQSHVTNLDPFRPRWHSLKKPVVRSRPRIESTVSTVQDSARAILRNHPHLKRLGESVQVDCHTDLLVLTGTVSSFYLKQLAQESVRHLGSHATIDNQIVVRYE